MTENVPEKLDDKSTAKIACVAFAVLSVVVYYIPFGDKILYPFSSLYTFVHEAGHGIAAILVGGSFKQFVMYTNGSGVATTAVPDSRLAQAFVAFGGLVAPAIWAIIFLFLARNKRVAAWGMLAVGIVSILSVIILVRSLFGIFFIGIFGLILGGIGYYGIQQNKKGTPSSVPQYSLLLMAMMLCTLVYTRGDYLFTKVAHTSQGELPSDVQAIAENLFLPYWFWGGLIALISAVVVIGGLYMFFKEPKENAIEDKSGAA